MAVTVAPNPRVAPTFAAGMSPPRPVTMSPELRAKRSVPLAPPAAPRAASSRTMAPMAAAQSAYQEAGDPFNAFAQGWVNASSVREEESVAQAERDIAASSFQDHEDLANYVRAGTLKPEDALRIKETRDQALKTSEAEQARKAEITDYLGQLAQKDERYAPLLEQYGAGVIDEDGLGKAISDLDKQPEPTGDQKTLKQINDERKASGQPPLSMEEFLAQGKGGADAETFAMQPTYYRVTDPVTKKTTVKFGQLGDRGTFKETALPEGAEPAIPVQQLNTETGFQPVTKFGDVPAEAPVTPIDNAGAARDTAIGKGEGELEVEAPARKRKAEGALNALERQVSLVGQDIDKAVQMADANPLFTTGFLGDWSSAVAGSPAYDLKQTLLTIQANVGFDRLQEMRQNSPTGGALGAISDKETALLQAVNGALAQGQSKDQFKENLLRVKALQAEVLAERKGAFSTDFGGGAAAGATPEGVDPALWEVMTPEERALWQ